MPDLTPTEPPRKVRRILLKISGESLGDDGAGVSPTVVAQVAQQIARVHHLEDWATAIKQLSGN